MQQEGLPIIISAPSGTGKTKTCQILRKKLPSLNIVTSHTTRKIRSGELEGVDYHFISKENFEAKIKKNDFLEWAKVHTNYYGTCFESIKKSTSKLGLFQFSLLNAKRVNSAICLNLHARTILFIAFTPAR